MIKLQGMYGFGDCLHQRALVRELIKQDDVALDSVYWLMYEDLVREYGGRFSVHKTMGLEPRVREGRIGSNVMQRKYPNMAERKYRITYSKEAIRRHGSILAAQFACCNLKMPERPDFSLPVPLTWRTRAKMRILNDTGKPLMVYRPSVLNNVWLSKARSPVWQDYARLYESIRDQFYVVSVCNLGNKGEHIDGEEQYADQYFHYGELPFDELAGLFAEADLAFTCPGFAPVLSQAVGTPTVIVYGGNEKYVTTNIVGKHLAPTLAIEPINPCACHLKDHDCDKTMDVPLQLMKLGDFVSVVLGKLSREQLTMQAQDLNMGYA